MKILKIVVPLLIAALIGLAVLAPIGPMPGIFIGGVEAASPDVWPDTSQVHEIKLKVPGAIPRVVIVWVIDYEGDLYVVGNSSSGWVKMLGQGGNVAMQLEGATYSLSASLMKMGWEPVMASYVEKYQPDYPDIVDSFPSPAEAVGKIAVFKLSRS